MENDSTFTNFSDNSKPVYDEYLPGAVQVLVEWLLLIISTLIGFFNHKDDE